jgi:beta-lactamase class A
VTISPAQAQATFTEAMEGFYGKLSGPVGMKVKQLATGLELNWNADEMFQTASTLKVPLLYELYRQADAGEIDLQERVTLRHADRVPGSGVYQHLDDGLQPTMRDLGELMITVSDNWATDIIFRRLGKDRVTTMLEETGMSRTSLPLTIRELFCVLAELDPNDPKVTWEYLREYLKTYNPSPTNPGMIADRHNDVSTPADMVRLLELIDAGTGLSSESRTELIDILKHQNFTSIIPYRLPTDAGIETAHKTGSLRGVKNDVGIVYSPDLTYAIAFMSRGQDDVPAVVDAMSHASRWVWDYLSRLTDNASSAA